MEAKDSVLFWSGWLWSAYEGTASPRFARVANLFFLCIFLNILSISSRASWREATIGRGVAVKRPKHTEGTRGKEMTPEQSRARQRQHVQRHFSFQRRWWWWFWWQGEKEKDNSTSDRIEGLTKIPSGESSKERFFSMIPRNAIVLKLVKHIRAPKQGISSVEEKMRPWAVRQRKLGGIGKENKG